MVIRAGISPTLGHDAVDRVGFRSQAKVFCILQNFMS